MDGRRGEARGYAVGWRLTEDGWRLAIAEMWRFEGLGEIQRWLAAVSLLRARAPWRQACSCQGVDALRCWFRPSSWLPLQGLHSPEVL